MINQAVFNNYRVGDDAMDSQHWHVIQMLNDVNACNDSTFAVLKMDAFMSEWQKHLAHEEQFMNAINFPYFQAHKALHAGLLSDYAALRETMTADQTNADPIRHYAKKALSLVLDHIDHYDRQYGDWLKDHPKVAI